MNEEQREYSGLFAGVRYSLLKGMKPPCATLQFLYIAAFILLWSAVF